jgi:hypothetical protein
MVSFTRASWFVARLIGGLSVYVGGTMVGARAHEEWPGPEVPIAGEPADDVLIRSHQVCVFNALDSAGDVGSTIAFRSHRDGDRLSVSYFVNWSTERPWGDKPAIVSLAIDSVYSHFFFVLPGLRYLLHGPNDIEGATVIYRVKGDRLSIIEGFADDESHDPVHLTAQDLADGDNGTVLMTAVWSHQLGAHGAAQASARATPGSQARRCYRGAGIIPMTSALAQRFRLGTAAAPLRARPAWR